MALELAFHHDNKGNPVNGSVDTLIKGIADGRRVRAVLKDSVGHIAYNYFSTIRVDRKKKLVTAALPLRPATDDFNVLFDTFGVNVAVIDSTGRFTRRDGLGAATQSLTKQFEVKWFLD
ncbi:MAG TPA: hypothetical protein VJM12_03290 [Pyrinomonadaceae bacterium]|nr:hypothetical protein [Pyrinomonadaceae bacterium]